MQLQLRAEKIFKIAAENRKKSEISVAVYLRSLWIRPAQEKNIHRPSRELMNCKENRLNSIFHVSPNFDVTDPNHIRITLVKSSGLIRNRYGANQYSQSFSF